MTRSAPWGAVAVGVVASPSVTALFSCPDEFSMWSGSLCLFTAVVFSPVVLGPWDVAFFLCCGLSPALQAPWIPLGLFLPSREKIALNA